MLKVGDRVIILYAGARPSLVGKKGTVKYVCDAGDKYDYRVNVDGTQVKVRDAVFNGDFYFYKDEIRPLEKGKV